MAAPLTLLLILFILLVAGLQVWPKPSRQARHPTTPRLPRPRTPDNYPLCRQPHYPVPPPSPLRTPVKPWSERKSHRGAHKHASTAGYACPNPNCLYEGIPDPEVHALVGYGRHGQQERIQDFRCQACGTKFTVRRNIPLYRLKTASHRVAEVLSAMGPKASTSAPPPGFSAMAKVRSARGSRVPDCKPMACTAAPCTMS